MGYQTGKSGNDLDLSLSPFLLKQKTPLFLSEEMGPFFSRSHNPSKLLKMSKGLGLMEEWSVETLMKVYKI